MLQEIDALVRTSPTELKKPTPLEEADTIIDIFDNTLFDTVPQVYRRFDDWVLGEDAGSVPPVCPAFFRPGSWIGSDRDGNPNVTAKVSRRVAAKYFAHMVAKLAQECRNIGRNLTLESRYTAPSEELMNLWSHLVEMSETLTGRVADDLGFEPHRAVMLVMAARLEGTVARNADIMYLSPEELLADLRTVQDSLARAGAARAAYGPVQTLIWQVETFGFHMVEMEFRQHSLVHERALADIRAHGVLGKLDPMTREVLDTFRAIGAIQKRYGQKMARRYIVSFTKSARHMADVYELAELAFSHAQDVPELDVIPLFEQLEDLENCVTVLDGMLQLPAVQRRLAQTGRRMEVMLGYSDSSKDAGPVTATLALHSAQERIARWAEERGIDVVLMHGRAGEPRGARAAEGVGELPIQGDRAGRGHLRTLRQPLACAAPYRKRRGGHAHELGAVGRARQHRGIRTLLRCGRAFERSRLRALSGSAAYRRLRAVVLHRHAFGRSGPAAHRQPSCQARLGSPIA